MRRRTPVVDLTERKASVTHYFLEWDRVANARFFGDWFGHEREQLNLTRFDIAKRLGIALDELAIIERLNRQIPGAWIGPMAQLGFRFALFGNWFRIEREHLGMSRPALAARLGVTVRLLQKLETTSPSAQVPPELIAKVIALGFRLGADTSPTGP